MSLLDAFELDFAVASLQELTASTLHDGHYEWLEYPIARMRALLAKPLGCFRACGILLDMDLVKDMHKVTLGHSHVRIWVRLKDWTQTLCVVCAHLPQSGRSLQDLADALQSLQEDVWDAMGRSAPMVLLGDLNACMVNENSARSNMILSCLLGLGLHHFSGCVQPTRDLSLKRLDHIVYNDAFVRVCQPLRDDDALPWVVETYNWQAKESLGVDHVLIAHDLVVTYGNPLRRNPCGTFRKVGKYHVADLEALQQGIQQYHLSRHQDSFNFFAALRIMSGKSMQRSFPISYVDSDEIKDLCRLRSVTSNPEARRDLSHQIFVQRKLCRQTWRRRLWIAAAGGNWRARQALQQPFPRRGSLMHFALAKGSTCAAVAALQGHFALKFCASDPSSDTPLPWNIEAVTEVLPELPEIHRHISQLKNGKTTGPSGISNDFITAVMQLDGGPAAVQHALHTIIQSPKAVPSEVFYGLVVLLAKEKVVLEPKHVRPIVLTETLTKLAARICSARVVQHWPQPPEMMGARPGAQVAEAIWVAKRMFMTSRMYEDQYVYIKIDIAAAFDSMKHSAVRDDLVRYYHPSHGASARFLDFLLTHQVLHFTAFGQTWTQTMGRGCVQGGCHSPLLFSRVVANATRRLRDMWIATGEDPPFFAGDYGFWALWFVDDGILCFRNMQQLQRLFPRLQQSLAHLGLQINMSKSKLLGWSLPAMLPTCVDGIQVVQQTVFLGVPVSISYDDSSAVQNLLRRSVQAFFSNRRLLTESTVSISLRMRMFDAVVTSTIRWALGTLLPSVSTLNALRVQCTTLLVWTLRLRQHPSWVDVQQLPMIRHIAKIWGRCWWGFLWDVLLLQQHWNLAGHMVRSSSIMSAAFAQPQPVHSGARNRGLRRYRTGPDNTGFARLRRFLCAHELQPDLAHNRHEWETWQSSWVSSFLVHSQPRNQNVLVVPVAHMAWCVECQQGICFGSQTVFARAGTFLSKTLLQICHLHRTEGWMGAEMPLMGPLSFEQIVSLLWDHLLPVVHLRLFLYTDDTVSFPFLPPSSESLWSRHIVCEISVVGVDSMASVISDGLGWPS